MSLIIRNCPNCNNNKFSNVFSKKLKNFDNFNLLCDYQVVKCNNCSFIYNNNINDKLLNEFYSNESLYSSDSSYGTGGNNSGDIKRYNTYLETLDKYVKQNQIICDVGCGKGGFVKFLHKKNYKNSIGIELDQRLIDLSNTNKILKTELYKYPFKNKEIDCYTFTHVFEHILNLKEVIKEIHRTLKDDGILFIEVPDAGNYHTNPVFDFYWFTIKEHINHFTLESLSSLLVMNGFELIDKKQSGIMYNNEEYSYPSLRCVFKKTKQVLTNTYLSNDFSLDTYINQEKSKIQLHKTKINKILEKYKYIYFWGIGQEFLTLASFIHIDLESNNIFLVDKNTDKQKLKFKNKEIIDPSLINLENAKNTCIIICSVFNSEIIKETIKTLSKELSYHEI